MINNTKFDSYCVKGFAKGCEYCVQGRKLVLFVSGKCSRNCKYCSLSLKRKNVDKIWANERECKNIKEILEETKASKAYGAGITGGDPLLCLNKTLGFVKTLKNKFGKQFHVHIYLPTELVTEEKLKKLKKAGVDEVRFHPRIENNEKIVEFELEKISLASKFWKRENIGIEVPMFPDKILETFYLIKSAAEMVGFVNLNELEISDTNFDFIKSKYKLNEDTYTIKGSKEAGLEILRGCEKEKLNLKVHLCMARTKNFFQYKNRVKLREILPFGYKTEEGSVRYFIIDLKGLKENEISLIVSKFKGNCFLDKKKRRLILSEKIIKKILKLNYEIERVEELPTFDGTELEKEIV
jgi:uncharacterized protein